MTDIVERLRNWSGQDGVSILTEAADEIERLRAMLAICQDLDHWIVEQARLKMHLRELASPVLPDASTGKQE